MTVPESTLGHYDIRSEARGAHWVAWICRAGDRKPVDGVVLVGETQQEAEQNARRWAERLQRDPALLRG